MNCPVCGSSKTKVTRTLPSKSNSELFITNIYRTRMCRGCEHQFITLEITQPPKEIIVAKKNNKNSTFSYEKLFNSIQKACSNLRIPYEEQRSVFTNVMKELNSNIQVENKTRIMSYEIGSLVMKHLKLVNSIAWLRYMSYYVDDEESIKKNIRLWLAQDIDSIE